MKNHGLNCLPQEIKLNIFSRLPVESVLDCRLICRAWRDLLQFHDNTYFANLHLRQQLIQQDGGSDSSMMNFVVMNGIYVKKPRVLYYLKYHDQCVNIRERQPNIHTRKIDFKFTANVREFVGSSNGLICLSVITIYRYRTYNNAFMQPLYICNPITKEFVILPKMRFDTHGYEEFTGVRTVHGFGYHPLIDKYKVVRICYVGDQDKPQSKALIEVYTLGSGSGWRSKGETNCYTWPSDLDDADTRNAVGVCVDGALHWLPQVSTEILIFDLATEEFHLLPTPPSDRFTLRRLCVIRNCLCLIYEYPHKDRLDFDLWFLKKNMEENGSYNRKVQHYKSPSWIRGFSLPYDCPIDGLFALTATDEVLFVQDGRILCYNLKTKQNCILSEGNGSWVVPISHINSFVSLKAPGERAM